MSTALVPCAEECPLCRDQYTLAAVGPCDHRICFKCSVRLRVVCGVTECPQCRKSCEQVIITRFPGTFLSLLRSIGLQKKGFLYTENDLLRDVEDLLANKCKFCSAGLVFGSFDELRKHCNKAHRLLFCDFCYENLKLFPSERKAYTSTALVEHLRCGDAGDTSYRPHPPCHFCNNQRFFDDDTLYRHMKSDHFSCHLCYASNIFYSDYFELRRHFQAKHYLCEEGTCREARFTNAFSNELDLKGHRAAYHANLMTKEELRENAKLDLAVFSRLDLTNSPSTSRRDLTDQRMGSEANRAGERGERISRYERRLREIQREREVLQSDASDSDSNVRGPEAAARLVPAEFPALGGHVAPAGARTAPPPSTGPTEPAPSSSAPVAPKASEGDISAAERIALTTRTHNVGKISIRTEEDFPALCPTAGPSLKGTAWNASKKNVPKSASGGAAKKSKQQRVSSSVATAPTVIFVEPPKKERPVSAKVKSEPKEGESKGGAIKKTEPDMDFPPLSSNTGVSVTEPPVVIQPSKKKKKEKPWKTEPKATAATEPTTTVKEDVKKVEKEALPTEEFPPLGSTSGISSRFDTVDDEEARYYAKMDAGGARPSNLASPKPAPKVTSPPPGFAVMAAAKPSETKASLVSPVAASPKPRPITEKPNISSTTDFPDLPTPAPRPVIRKAPPPGFTIIMPPPAPAVEEPPKETPKPVTVEYPFWRSPDYDKRNAALQNAIEKNLNARSVEEFRLISRRFREGILPAFDFLSKCVDLFPRKQLGYILSELIVLLPDVKKQHALFDTSSADSLLSTLIPHLLSSCPVCDQITTSRDAPLHRQSHNQVPLSPSGLLLSDVDSSGNIDLSNYVIK